MSKLAIRYSLRARQEEIDLLEYIQVNFDPNKDKQVFDRTEIIMDQLSNNLKIYRSSSKRKGLRKCFLSEQTSIYHRINKVI